jgi:ABC-type transport system involved in multi-copper enzyme maturation permease subunit
MRAFRSELIRIRRPAFLFGGIGLMAMFAGLVSIFIFTSAENAPAAPSQPGQGTGAYPVAEIASPGGFLTALPTVSRLAGVILLALWAIAVATDYSTGLIRILAQAHPNRTRLLGGKIAALSVFTLLATTVTTLVVVVVARPLARLEGIPIEAWKTDFASHLGKGLLDFTIAGLVWGLIGLMLAVLTRSSAIAIGIGLGFLLVAEGLISIVAPNASSYLPGGTLDTLAAGGNDQLAWGAALGLVGLYGVIAAIVSLGVFRTRDIIS